MPEGPEIRRTVDRLASAVAGRTARRVRFAFERLRHHEALLSGRRIRAVEARGKAVLVRFAGGRTIYSHNQLYGRWFVRPAGQLPATRRSLRLSIHTRDRSALLYSASEIEVLADGELEDHPYLARLGPDPLDEELKPATVARRAVERRFRRRSFAALLLDQGFLAGIGNYLRSEILFVSGLHPRRRPVDCAPAELTRFARAALTVTRRSYRSGGITIRQRQAAALRRQGLPRREYRHAVFGRGGACRACGTSIVKQSLAGRRAYFCPVCQPPAREPRTSSETAS